MTIPRQLAPTVGPAHGGFEFLKGSFEGLKGYAVGRMTKSRRGKLYIDDANWGPDAGSIEYGYRVPFGGIHVFIGKIGEPGPEPDLCADLIETAQRARPARARPALRHAFVGCIHGGPSDRSGSGDETAAGSDGESATDESNSLYQLQDGRLMGCSDGDSIPDPFEPPSRVGIFMAGAQPVQNPAAGAGNPVPSPAQVLMDLTDKMTALLTAVVDPADQAQHDAEVAQLKLDLVKAKEDLAAEGIRMAAERAALDAQTQLIQAQSFRLTMDQNASNEVMRRRHQKAQSRLPPVYDPRNLFNTPGAGSSNPPGVIVPGSGTPIQPIVMGPPRCPLPRLSTCQYPRVIIITRWRTWSLRQHGWRLSQLTATLRRLLKPAGSGNSFRQHWRSKRRTPTAGTGSTRPLVQAGARVTADTWSQRPAQVTSDAMTRPLAMARLIMEPFTQQTKTERGKRRSRCLS